MADAAKACGLPFGTFKYRAIKLGVYSPNQQHLGRTFVDGRKRSIPLIEILNGDHPTYQTRRLKQRLIQEGMLDEVCVECGVGTTYNEKALTLELDHINGDPRDHRLNNVRLLCPNCHSQTPTFRGRNKK